MKGSLRHWLISGFLAALASPVLADPWIAPGDEGLRNDIQLLADAGVLRGPVTTWPISWPDVARDLEAADALSLDSVAADAFARLRRRARSASARGFSGMEAEVSAARQPTELRTFADTPREDGEVAVKASWLGEHLALNLQGTYAVDPADGQELRPDGSYLGLNLGNVMLSVGWIERWWGPGWDGSLILSTNARPMPTATLERNYSDAFETRWLSWLGPWRASVSLGKADSEEVPVPGVRFFAARVNFKPRPWLELGLSHTAQWCGGERSCDWDTFTDLLLGQDNQVENDAPADEQPGNQLAGYDMRLQSPWRALPVAFHTQWIGEDEAGGLPSKFMGQFGLELWGGARPGAWRMRAEYSDTACNFSREIPEFNCAYRSGLYPQGYTHRGRIIGHSMDNDGRMYSLAGLLSRANGDVVSLTVRRTRLNRDGGEHTISRVPLDLDNVELRYSRAVGAARLTAGLGYEDPPVDAGSSSGVSVYAVWKQGF